MPTASRINKMHPRKNQRFALRSDVANMSIIGGRKAILRWIVHRIAGLALLWLRCGAELSVLHRRNEAPGAIQRL
jgi:hypothetical protein